MRAESLLDKIKSISYGVGRGKVGLFPSKNGYMIIGRVNESTVRRIGEVKRKTIAKPLVRVMRDSVSDSDFIKAYQKLSSQKKQLLDTFKNCQMIFAFGDMGGFVFSTNPYERILLQRFKLSFYASSANISGEPTPFDVSCIDKDIKDSVDFILDVGPLDKTPDYSVFDVINLRVLREGKFVNLITECAKKISKE